MKINICNAVSAQNKKYCPKCGQNKNKTEFCKDKCRKDGHDHYCKKCRAKMERDRYRNDPDHAIKKAEVKKARRVRVMDIVRSCALLEGCVITGGNEDLIFHHTDPTTKSFGMNKAFEHSWNTILEEMDKCVVVTRSTHGKIHSALKGKKVKELTPELIEFLKKHYGLDIKPDDEEPELEVIEGGQDDELKKIA